MKKFYIYFITAVVGLSALLYISVWWFLGGTALIGLAAVLHYYNEKLKAFDATVEELEIQVEQLQLQLDRSLIKEEKATREAKQVRQQKQDLLTSISHEVRTPMNGVLGMSMLLMETSLTDEQKDYIDTIRQSGENLLATVNDILVDDLLDYSKLDRTDKKPDNIDFDLRDTTEEVIAMFVNKAGKTGVELVCDIDNNVPLQLHGDNKRLRIILMNLLENAVKHTRQGEVVVSILLTAPKDESPVLHFEVRDTGEGIEEEQLKSLFHKAAGSEFNRGKTSMGLVICRKQTELMGGKIEAKSKSGAGSTFSFNLPFHYSKAPVRNAPGAEKLINLAGREVIVADDNHTSRSTLSKQLKGWKMKPSIAASGVQVLEMLGQNEKIDAVIADYSLQQPDVLQLAKTIKNKYPEVTIILLDQPRNEREPQEKDLFSGIISKPVRHHVLKDILLAHFTEPLKPKQNEPDMIESNFSQQHPLHILLAEDNLINQKIATKILTKLGYQPKIANNGKEAFEMAQQELFDIILMDVQMPEMDGLEATKTIRGTLPVQPVIMAMTANVLQGDRDACIQAGMDDYISKPINLDELLSHLEKWATVINERKKAS